MDCRTCHTPLRGGNVAVTAVATWATLGGTSLIRVGAEMSEHLYDDDIDEARALLPSLCGRDPNLLDVGGIARATTESLAENTSDAHTGPLVWAALAGVPGSWPIAPPTPSTR